MICFKSITLLWLLDTLMFHWPYWVLRENKNHYYLLCKALLPGSARKDTLNVYLSANPGAKERISNSYLLAIMVCNWWDRGHT